MKYFCVSDLHGIDPKELTVALIDAGFESGNPDHKLVVAGDITDGQGSKFGYDDRLIQSLMLHEKFNQLVIVKGNHDDWTIQGRPMIHATTVTEENREWLKTLRYQVETKDFYIAHGMYLKDKLKDDDGFGYESSWASPALYYQEPNNWWYMERWIVELIHAKYPTLDSYEESFDKPVLLGHFGAKMVVNYIEAMIDLGLAKKEKLVVDEKGFVSYGKIHWLDSELQHNKRLNGLTKGLVSVKVMEF